MPVELDVWRIDDGQPKKVSFDSLADETKLEDVLENQIDMLGLDLLVIGRQVHTSFGKIIDLLGVDVDGDLHVIELKKDKTPRDVVGQVLDYASWVRELGYDEVVQILLEQSPEARFESVFEDHFGTTPPESINQSHHMVIVASELDAATERIVGYLSDEHGVSINAVLFQHFSDGGHEYLARTWLVDPKVAVAAQSKRGSKKAKEPWNGSDFYISFGVDAQRSWADAVRYGFVSGGGGRWYSQSLGQLFPGARVFVNIPKTGFVGVGLVTAEAVPVRDFQVEVDGGSMPILDAPHDASGMDTNVDDDETCEWLVRVDWITTLGVEDAIWEKGMFANQNTAAKLRNSFTLERLPDRFELED